MKQTILSWLIAQIIRAVGITLRIRVDDKAGVLLRPPVDPMIWVFWHNRVFVMPWIYRRYLGFRSGAVLTSASGDGEMIARVMRRFGADAVRGSTSRRSVAAMVGMVGVLKRGQDIVVTPDGPRGPRYRLQPGLVKLAFLTGVPVFPVNVRYHSAWRLKTWDGFLIPRPFSRVDVVLEDLRRFAPSGTGGDPVEGTDALESARVELEDLLWKD